MPVAVRILLLAAFALFLACLPMQALQTDFMHAQIVIAGWQATALGLNVLGGVPREAGFVVIALAALLNISFPLLTALALRRPDLLQRYGAAALLFACAAGTFAVWAPWALSSASFVLLAGYHVWIAAHVLQIVALLVLSVQGRRSPLAAA